MWAKTSTLGACARLRTFLLLAPLSLLAAGLMLAPTAQEPTESQTNFSDFLRIRFDYIGGRDHLRIFRDEDKAPITQVLASQTVPASSFNVEKYAMGEHSVLQRQPQSNKSLGRQHGIDERASSRIFYPKTANDENARRSSMRQPSTGKLHPHHSLPVALTSPQREFENCPHFERVQKGAQGRCKTLAKSIVDAQEDNLKTKQQGPEEGPENGGFEIFRSVNANGQQPLLSSAVNAEFAARSTTDQFLAQDTSYVAAGQTTTLAEQSETSSHTTDRDGSGSSKALPPLPSSKPKTGIFLPSVQPIRHKIMALGVQDEVNGEPDANALADQKNAEDALEPEILLGGALGKAGKHPDWAQSAFDTD